MRSFLSSVPVRKTYLIASLLVVFSLGCKKEATEEKNIFIINGVQNISPDFNSNYNQVGMYTTLEVKQYSGVQEKVNLSAEDLPPGVSVRFSTTGGVPDFYSEFAIFFDRDKIVSGVYKARIVAKSTSVYRAYEFDIRIPPKSHMMINKVKYPTNPYFSHGLSTSFSVSTVSPSPTYSVSGEINDAIPEGVSNIPIDGTLRPSSTTLFLKLYDGTGGTYEVSGNTGKFAIVTKSGSSISIGIPEVELTSNTNQKIMVGGLFIK